ncbi:MAG: alpha/beta fold hydrolase [Pseudomonadota bacterium]
MTPTTFLRVLLLGAAAALALPVTAADPLPAELFFRNPALRSPTLSPNGKKIAVLVPAGNGRIGLAVADTATPDKFKGIAQFDDADIGSVTWINDERMVFDLTDEQAAADDQLGSGLYAVDADGSDFNWLIQRTWNYSGPNHLIMRALGANHRLFMIPLDGSDDVLLKRWKYARDDQPPVSEVMRLNTRSGGTRHLYPGSVPEGASGWLLDRQLRPRVVMANTGKRDMIVWWREADGKEWTELFRYSVADQRNAALPVTIDRDGQLYVSAWNPDSSDGTSALFRYDTKQKKIDGKAIVSLPGFDFVGGAVYDDVSKEMLGVSYLQEARGTLWFNKRMRAVQETIDKLLPATNNELDCSACTSARYMVVSASSDIQAPVFFLFDNETNKLSPLGYSRPWLPSTAMATGDFQRIKARDGLTIPVYITKPKGKGPFPTVVLVHGGPFIRVNQWGFNAETQFLASRGYAVIEPEFRGTTGYGSKLFRAGWKQWGLAMQDDITDATKWAIAQGLADPERIAIAGASYGGYATMMGLLREPELYKAGVNWVGVTDIELMYSIGWSDFMDADNPWVKYGMPRMIGHPKTDAAQLAATSPLQQAARIKRPVLMAYGEEDMRVPLPHGTKMRNALIASGNKNVEWVQYKSEGHGFYLTKNNVDFWTRVERFLDKHVKQ